eukprot:1192267-Prorocentrum_minimum.AAC.5
MNVANVRSIYYNVPSNARARFTHCVNIRRAEQGRCHHIKSWLCGTPRARSLLGAHQLREFELIARSVRNEPNVENFLRWVGCTFDWRAHLGGREPAEYHRLDVVAPPLQKFLLAEDI